MCGSVGPTTPAGRTTPRGILWQFPQHCLLSLVVVVFAVVVLIFVFVVVGAGICLGLGVVIVVLVLLLPSLNNSEDMELMMQRRKSDPERPQVWHGVSIFIGVCRDLNHMGLPTFWV